MDSVRESSLDDHAITRSPKSGGAVRIADAPRSPARPFRSTGNPVLDRLIAAGAVIPPSADGPIPRPEPDGDPTLDVAAELAAAREEERW